MVKTRKSLWAAGFALLVCILLLIGTTFAWFTDSVSNSGNRIQAGTLDIDLLMDKDGTGDSEYTSIANGTGDIFDEAGNGANWEPGMTQIVYLAVQNNGSLAINYNIILDITDGDPGLVGSLEYAVIDGATPATLNEVNSWDAIKDVSGVQIGEIVGGKVTAALNGIIKGIEGKTEYFALAVHMAEDAGNQYQGGSITIDVNVVAKQATAEQDGFGSAQYDADAKYPLTVSVDNVNSLNDALNNNPGVPVEIMLDSDLSAGVMDLINVDATIDTGTNTLTVSKNEGFGLKVNSGTLTLIGNEDYETVKVSGNPAGATIASAIGADSVINIESGAYTPSGAYVKMFKAIDNGTIYVNGGNYSSSGAGGIVFYADGGRIIVNDGTFGYVNQNDNGARYGVTNSGVIYVSKSVQIERPTDIAGSYQISEEGNYWVITAQ